jgi:hypothetical protein
MNEWQQRTRAAGLGAAVEAQQGEECCKRDGMAKICCTEYGILDIDLDAARGMERIAKSRDRERASTYQPHVAASATSDTPDARTAAEARECGHQKRKPVKPEARSPSPKQRPRRRRAGARVRFEFVGAQYTRRSGNTTAVSEPQSGCRRGLSSAARLHQ